MKVPKGQPSRLGKRARITETRTRADVEVSVTADGKYNHVIKIGHHSGGKFVHHGYAKWDTFQDFVDVVEGRAPSNWSLADSFRKRTLARFAQVGVGRTECSRPLQGEVGRSGLADLQRQAILNGGNIMLEEGDGRQLEKKIDAFGRNLANYHQAAMACYGDLDKRLDSKLDAAEKSKWTPVLLLLYSGVLVWMGAALERWL